MHGIFDRIINRKHEELVFVHDQNAGLKGIISIHSTILGPSLGGLRVWNYIKEDDAIEDVLRLSEAMTYKAAAANLRLGGGKAVIIADPFNGKTPELFRAMGRYIEGLGGRYITAEDVGTSVEDMEYLRETTKYVTGTKTANGGSGDPSPTTANGVFEAMEVCVQEGMGAESLRGMLVAVQGIGHVGYRLCRKLHDAGAKLIVTDVHASNSDRARVDFGAAVISPETIYDQIVDVFAPCALGGVLNDDTIPRLKCKIIAGAANNQLFDTKKHGRALEEKGILYAPDFVANAGGLINIYYRDILGMPCESEAWEPTGIAENMRKVIQISRRNLIPTSETAMQLALSRIDEAERKTANSRTEGIRN